MEHRFKYTQDGPLAAFMGVIRLERGGQATLENESNYQKLKRNFNFALLINAAFVLAEFLGGFHAKSVALISDAGHNTIDQAALFLALYAHILSTQPAGSTRTFGYHRVGIIISFINSIMLLLTAAAIAIFAVARLLHPVQVQGYWIILIALLSFGANFGIALLLQSWSKSSLSIRAVFWHMLSDAWVSLGVVLSGVGILITRGFYFLDPLVSMIVASIIAKAAWPILKESLGILLEFVRFNTGVSDIERGSV